MKKIPYRYTNLSKQALIVTIMLYFVMLFIIMVEIVIFKIDGYYEATNIPLTLLLYAVIFFLVGSLLFGHRVCYSLYDEETLIYRNRLLRREKTLKLADAHLAVLDTFGIKFYSSEDGEAAGEKPIFFLPFFRDGIVEAIPLNKFYTDLKAREDMRVIKKFKVLPGYTKKWNFVAIAYGFLAILVLLNLSTPVTLIIVLFQNH